MTAEDLEQLRTIAERLPTFESVGVLSPLRDGEMRVFPGTKAIPRWRWDLERPGSRRFDLLVACNVFMYSPDPEAWLRRVLASCRYLLLLDLVRRRRSPHGELGLDGDAVRYAVGGEEPRTPARFDLSLLGSRVLAFRTFHGGANEFDEDPLHFVALMEGDLVQPILRLDDYPTGIRPLLPDLGPLHDVIRVFEAHEIPYHLGIVPALVTDEMTAFLRTLRYVRPVVHGYDHAYPKYAPMLVRKDDPFNERTVGTFNEFSGQPYEQIAEKLYRGRLLLEDGLGRSVDAYVPPCNRGDRRTGRALEETGYRYYLSEKRIPFCRLPYFTSDFYGRSNDYDLSASPDVITFHVTWEWDVVRRGNRDALPRALSHVRERVEAARAVTNRLVDAFVLP